MCFLFHQKAIKTKETRCWHSSRAKTSLSWSGKPAHNSSIEIPINKHQDQDTTPLLCHYWVHLHHCCFTEVIITIVPLLHLHLDDCFTFTEIITMSTRSLHWPCFIEIMTMFTWLLPWEYSYYLWCMSRLKHYCRIIEVLIIMVMSRMWLSLSYWFLHRNCNYILLAPRSQLC